MSSEELNPFVMRNWSAVVALLVACVGPSAAVEAAETNQWEGASALEQCLGPAAIDKAVQDFIHWDQSFKGGKGYSESSDLGILASSETPYWLLNYIRLFEVTKDATWLDKCNDHFRSMISSLTPGSGDYRGWRTSRYGVSLVEVGHQVGSDGVQITPGKSRVAWERGGDKITGDSYAILLSLDHSVIVSNVSTGSLLGTVPYRNGLVIEQIPGTKLKVQGGFQPGCFLVRTIRAHPLRYAYDDGCIARAMAQWLRFVLADGGLNTKYAAEVKTYSRFLEHDVFEYWEQWWLPTEGTYSFTNDETEEFPSAVLPHNQYLSLGRAWLMLSTLTSVSDRPRLYERAKIIAEHFKRYLHKDGDRWTWNYWDPRPTDPSVWIRPDDLSHAAVCASFVAEAAEKGVVFTSNDVESIARTFLAGVTGAESAKPEFALRVNGQGKSSGSVVYDWLELSRWQPQIAEIGWRRFLADGRPASRIPSILLAAQASRTRRAAAETIHRVAKGRSGTPRF